MFRQFIFFVICFFSTVSWGMTFDEMVMSLTPQSLPLIHLESDADSTNHEYFVDGYITIAQYGHDLVQHNCLIRRRGKSAVHLPKKSYAIKLVDEFGEKVDDNILGLRNDNTWILDAMGIDKLRMRNRVLFDIWNEYSHTMWNTDFGKRNGTVGTMVEVFINNEYYGIYHLSDKVNRQLLNLRKVRDNHDGSFVVKGLLYKGKGNGVSNALIDYVDESTDSLKWNTFELQYPDEFPSQQAWQPLADLIDFNGKSSDEYFKAHYNEWYYVDNLVDYWVLLVAFGIDDMPYKNTFLSTPDINFNHRFMITPWDLDACLGREGDGKKNMMHSELTRLNNYGPYNRLIWQNIDGFRNIIALRWQELIETQLSPANLESHINAIAQRYVESGAWQRETERWKGTKIEPEDLDEEIEYVLSWYQLNIAYMSNRLLRWHDDYVEPDVISSTTITRIYNYMLGFETDYDEKLDLNEDGRITSSDITLGYNILLGN